MAKQTSDLKKSIGFDPETRESVNPDHGLIEFINLNLAALGEPIFGSEEDYPTLNLGKSLVDHYKARDSLLPEPPRPPVDLRVEKFLGKYLNECGEDSAQKLPGKTLNLTRHGIARMLSLPPDQDYFKSDIIESYRVGNGVLHNPLNDRRTTQGVFHVTEGGLPVPADKKAVPKITFARLLKAALNPPQELMMLPFTSSQESKAQAWVSLMLRPVICPEIPGYIQEKSMEIRFFAPGNMVCNLDFVESIFGNAGDPYLPENDAGLDVNHWSGHSGCVILAPHLKDLRKKDLGLPHVSEASERHKRDGMCWENEDEIYNDGGAFKITARNEYGVVVTLIADNYFGYSKKEVKTQIGYAANLFGVCEEEHAGGTLAFTAYDLGEEFRLGEYISEEEYTFDRVREVLGGRMKVVEPGYGIDQMYPDINYIPEGATFSLHNQTINWEKDGAQQEIKLMAGKTYILPYGYRVQLSKPAKGRRWRLIGTLPEPILCHKPCTVSGGGKSEISKSIADAIIHAPFFVGDLQKDLDSVESLLKRDYRKRFKDSSRNKEESRPILSSKRSLGSVIKLLTPNPDYTDEYNAFLNQIPTHIKELVLLLKRFYKPDWGDDWRNRFHVDIINGTPGHELKYRDVQVITSYLRLGYAKDGSWRVFSLRKDFSPAAKIQVEDDITTSVTVPNKWVAPAPLYNSGIASKVVQNCEYRLFQRPDDAIVRGYDKQTEFDMSRSVNFLSNYEPLSREHARRMVEDAVRFDYFTEPMKGILRNFVANPEKFPDYIVSPSHPRLVNGKPSKNPRYLQNRSTLDDPMSVYLADVGTRLCRKLTLDDSLQFPVTAVLPGHRNNPPENKVRSLAVFNPVHYLPLPEAFMEFTSSMTGKSPSTTGAGSEGALTKAPFNALLPITDLNNALVSFILTGAHPFITAAGCVGPNFRVDHDISLLIPEIWCRMKPEERNPEWLIENGFLEKVPKMEYEGKPLPTFLLGYRINQEFVNYFLGRIFTSPEVLFEDEMLEPEKQDMSVFADGLDNMMTTHRIVAQNYFDDGSIEYACPPMKALLYIMRDGQYEGKDLHDPGIRSLFTQENLLKSDWYAARLDAKQQYDIQRWENHYEYLEHFRQRISHLDTLKTQVKQQIDDFKKPEYRESLYGSIGRDLSFS